MDLTPFTCPRDGAQLLLASRASNTCMSPGHTGHKPVLPGAEACLVSCPTREGWHDSLKVATGAGSWVEWEEVFLILLAFTFV